MLTVLEYLFRLIITHISLFFETIQIQVSHLRDDDTKENLKIKNKKREKEKIKKRKNSLKRQKSSRNVFLPFNGSKPIRELDFYKRGTRSRTQN